MARPTVTPNTADNHINELAVEHERLLYGFDIPDVAFDDVQALGLDFGVDALVREGVGELLWCSCQGRAPVAILESSGKTVASAVACGAEEGEGFDRGWHCCGGDCWSKSGEGICMLGDRSC